MAFSSPCGVARALIGPLAAALALAGLAAGVAAEPAGVVSATLARAGGETRLALGFDGPAPAPLALFTLDAPPRVVLDLPEADWRTSPPSGAGLARAVRFGLAAPGRSRLVVDLAAPAQATAAVMGSALTLRLTPAPAAAFAAGAGWPEGLAPTSPPRPRPFVIAVDAGHGGADPGASGAAPGVGRVLEKDVTLRVSRAMAEALRAAGHRVVETRGDDRFVGLDARLALAAGADALVSIHADAAPQPGLSGGSVYTLSAAASDAAAAALARRENAADPAYAGLEPDVAALLAAMAAPAKAARSQALGAALLEALGAVGPTLPARPLRGAAFVVLRAAETPSALVELGFLSNPQDAARLADPAWAEAAGRALAAAVNRWAREGAIFRSADPVLPE